MAWIDLRSNEFSPSGLLFAFGVVCSVYSVRIGSGVILSRVLFDRECCVDVQRVLYVYWHALNGTLRAVWLRFANLTSQAFLIPCPLFSATGTHFLSCFVDDQLID
jgi:hypothetical protein